MRVLPLALASLLALSTLRVAAETPWRERPLPAESERLTLEAETAEDARDAARLYAKAIRLCPSNGPALYGLGGVLLGQNRPADSLKVFRRMNVLFPHDPEISVAIAIALARLPHLTRPQLREGIQIAEQALLLQPNDIEAWHSLSILYHLNGDYEQGAVAARKAIDLDAQNPIDIETTTRYQQQEIACNDALLVFSPLD